MKRSIRYSSRYRVSPRYIPFSVRRQEKRSSRKLLVSFIVSIIVLYVMFFWLLPNFIAILSSLKSPSTPIQKASESITLAPPVLSIPYEATNSASIALQGYAQPAMDVEIYLDDEFKTTTKTNEEGSFRTETIDLFLGTNNFYGKTVDSQGNSSLPSKTIRLIFDSEKPKLTVNEPSDNKEIKGGDKKVLVEGTVDSSGDITVTVNGMRLIVSSAGKFSQVFDISEGENNLNIVATDQAGNSTQTSRKVTYQP